MEASVDDALSPKLRRAFAVARRAARRVLERRLRLLRLAHEGYTKLSKNENALQRVRDDLSVLLRLALAWARREYKAIPWRSLLYATAALVYFVNPIDLIPDALVGIGFVDDAAVIAAVARGIQADLQQFLSWEARRLDEPEIDES